MKPLEEFLKSLIQKYGSPCAISAEAMADEWVLHSGLSALPCLSEIHGKLQSYGLSLEQATIPGLRGHHYWYRDDDPTIVYQDGEWRGAVEFTLLHELYEVMLGKLGATASGDGCSPDADVCRGANQFAAAVLMQKDIFLQALYQSHFDIVWLHQHFCCSYSAIAIRAVHLLDQVEDASRRDLACVLYQRRGDPQSWHECDPADFYVDCVACTSGLLPWSEGQTGGLLPRRGDGVSPGSIVELSLKAGRPVLLGTTRASAASPIANLVLLSRPVFWFGHLSKVILQGMTPEDAHALEAQAGRLQPRPITYSGSRLT